MGCGKEGNARLAGTQRKQSRLNKASFGPRTHPSATARGPTFGFVFFPNLLHLFDIRVHFWIRPQNTNIFVGTCRLAAYGSDTPVAIERTDARLLLISEPMSALEAHSGILLYTAVYRYGDFIGGRGANCPKSYNNSSSKQPNGMNG